jgi:hypothetical protein
MQETRIPPGKWFLLSMMPIQPEILTPFPPVAIVRLKKKVEDLSALRLGVVEEQPAGSAGTHRADALEHAPGRCRIYPNDAGRIIRARLHEWKKQ